MVYEGRRGSARPAPLVALSVGVSVCCLAWFVAGLPGSWAPPVIGWVGAVLATTFSAIAFSATAFSTTGSLGAGDGSTAGVTELVPS